MSEETRPQLRLDAPPKGLQPRRGGHTLVWLLVLVVVLQAGVLVRLFTAGATAGTAVAPRLDASVIRKLALDLEERGLDGQAASHWEMLLAQGEGGRERASIAYRAGRLRYDERDWVEAASDFILAEQLAKQDGVTLEGPVGRKLVDCLRRLGRYGEVGRELARRVQVGKSEPASRVLATYEGETITEATLDRMIERRVDQMLGPGVSPNDPRRSAMLEQFRSPEARRRLLEEFLREQLLARKAREEGIDKEDSFLELLDTTEQGLLASLLLNRELANLEPTDVELRNHFAAHADSYREPAHARVTVLELREGESAEEALAGVDSVEAFRAVAAERQGGGGGAAAVSDLPVEIVRGQPDPILGDTSVIFALEAGRWLDRPLEHEGRRFLVLLDSLQAGSQPDFEAVRERVWQDYMAAKRDAFSRKLFDELTKRYDVKILPWKPEDKDKKAGEGDGS